MPTAIRRSDGEQGPSRSATSSFLTGSVTGTVLVRYWVGYWYGYRVIGGVQFAHGFRIGLKEVFVDWQHESEVVAAGVRLDDRFGRAVSFNRAEDGGTSNYLPPAETRMSSLRESVATMLTHVDFTCRGFSLLLHCAYA